MRDPGALATRPRGRDRRRRCWPALVGDPIARTYPRAARNSINLDGCTAVIEELDGRGIDRFVFTSTCSNYGMRTSDEPATEESELAPGLALCRAEGRDRASDPRRAAADVDYAPTVLRIATAYGLSPRMRFDLTVSEFT